MPPAKASEADRTAQVVPEIRHTAPWRVVSAQALDARAFRVAFVDGTHGEVQMEAFLESAAVIGTVFEALRDPAEFAKVRVELGTVRWPHGAELAPDAMYDAIRERGVWILD